MNSMIDELIQKLRERFPDKDVKQTSRGEILVIEAASPRAPIIDTEINKILTDLGTKFKLKTGQLVWTLINNDLIVHLSPNLKTYVIREAFEIREAHWSTDPRDSHQENDADSTYAVIDANGQMVALFNTKQEAEAYVEKNRFS